MCVGFTNGCDDFKSCNAALAAMVPGSAISFNRIGFYHFAIFLGWAYPRGGNSDPIPLLCHLSGAANTKASVRIEGVRGIVQNSTIRVYHCDCSASKRAQVISECLHRVGETGYNVVTNNCEHFVRRVMNGENISYQSMWTFLAPPAQLPRLIVGGALRGAVSSSASSSCCSYGMRNHSCLGLIDPELDLLVIRVSDGGLKLVSVEVNSCCTREFTGSDRYVRQEMYNSRSCGTEGSSVVCKYCVKSCHQRCRTWRKCFVDGFCGCSHGEEENESATFARVNICIQQ